VDIPDLRVSFARSLLVETTSKCFFTNQSKQRDRTYAYASYLEKLRVGTEVDVR
jgi:hypothetical protein